MGFYLSFKKAITYCIIVMCLLAYFPGLPPDLPFSAYKLDERHPLQGPLKINNVLDQIIPIYEGHLIAPESMAIRNKEIYASLHHGEIAKVWGKEFEHSKIIVNISRKCESGEFCGRPLGLRFNKDGKLVVADCGRGLYLVDVDSGSTKVLYDSSEAIEGQKPLIPNDLDIHSSGKIYWTDSSSTNYLNEGTIIALADGSGRLFEFDPKMKINKVLMKGLHFANGVQLSKDESFVLVAETFRRKVHRYWLKGFKKGTSDTFVSGLPGAPDNIRPRKEGGFYIALASVDDPGGDTPQEILCSWPRIRKLITRFLVLSKNGAAFINKFIPNSICATVENMIVDFRLSLSLLNGNRAFVVEVDDEGRIIGSLQGYSGNIRFVSEVAEIGDCLLFGSFRNSFLGILCFSQVTQTEAPKDGEQKSQKDEL